MVCRASSLIGLNRERCWCEHRWKRALGLCDLRNKVKSANGESLWRIQKWNVSSQFVSAMQADAMHLFSVMQTCAKDNESATSQTMDVSNGLFRIESSASVLFNFSNC